MAFDIDSAFQTFLSQTPLAGAALWVAREFIRKHENVVQKLMETFENSNKSCEQRYQQVFDELMKIKESISNGNRQ